MSSLDNGRITPQSISEIWETPEIEDSISIESLYDDAGQGFEYLKEHLNKTFINAGDSLTAFYNFDTSSNNRVLLKQLFCLAITMLLQRKEAINEVNDDTYEKMNIYTINVYNSKRNAMF